MSLLIRNGEVVNDTGRQVVDVYCEDEQITRVGPALKVPAGTTIIDAAGKYVFPGFIDPHVHIYLPFMGTETKDTYETASTAALLGGTTCFIDLVTPTRTEDPLTCLDTWNAQSHGRSACDYAYHMTVSRFDEITSPQLREAMARGISSFKIYLAYKGTLGLNDKELYATLRYAWEYGVLVLAHCENEILVNQLQRVLLALGKRAPRWHHDSRPPVVEAEGVHHLLTFAELSGARTYIAHTTCRAALQEAVRARNRGVDVLLETCIQYLLLDRSYTELPDFEGAKYVVSPPLRDPADQAALWKALGDGTVATVASDHAPTDFAGQKSMGRDYFTRIPSGVPGIENRVPLLYTHGVAQGRLSLERFVEVASTAPARIFGLYPRKGAIIEGADADLVVFDPDWDGHISASTHAMNVDYSAYEGWPVKGRADIVTVRGRLAVQGGEFVGEIGRGRFVPRKPEN